MCVCVCFLIFDQLQVWGPLGVMLAADSSHGHSYIKKCRTLPIELHFITAPLSSPSYINFHGTKLTLNLFCYYGNLFPSPEQVVFVQRQFGACFLYIYVYAVVLHVYMCVR